MINFDRLNMKTIIEITQRFYYTFISHFNLLFTYKFRYDYKVQSYILHNIYFIVTMQIVLIRCCSKKCSFIYSQRATIRNYLSYLSEFFGIHLPINSEKFFQTQIDFSEGTLNISQQTADTNARNAWRNTCLWLPIINDVRIWCDSTCKFGAGFDESAILGNTELAPSSERRAESGPANYISLLAEPSFRGLLV